MSSLFVIYAEKVSAGCVETLTVDTRSRRTKPCSARSVDGLSVHVATGVAAPSNVKSERLRKLRQAQLLHLLMLPISCEESR